MSKLVNVLFSQIKKLFKIAPIIAQVKKTLEGENRSAIVNMAKNKVPIINPN